MDDSLRNVDEVDGFTSSLISRLADLKTDVSQYFNAVIAIRTLPMAERDGSEITRIEESRSGIEKECNFYQTELTEHISNFAGTTLPAWVNEICECQSQYREILYRLDLAGAAGQHLDGYPERSIDSYLTDYSLETVELINSFKSETLPKFHQDQLTFIQSIRNVLIGNGEDFSLVTLLKRDEPMSTFETIASNFETEIAGQVESVSAVGVGLDTLRQRANEITLAFNQFRANPVPLDI